MKKLILLAITFCFTGIFTFAHDTHYFMQGEKDIVSATPYGNNPAAGKYVSVGDTKIYYEVYGKGEPLLVLHGGGVGCTYEMGRFIDELSKDYMVIAPSTRGQGKSGIGTKAITYEQKAKDIMAAVDKVTKKPMIILGFSDGAFTAYKIASMYPKRVKKIVAIGAGELDPATHQFPVLTLDALAQYDKRFIEEKKALSPELEKLPDFLNRYYAFFNSVKVGKDLFSSIKCPVLLIAGELDANAPLDTVISAYKMLPNAQLAIIANAPHQAFIVNYDAVWANIKPFLNSK